MLDLFNLSLEKIITLRNSLPDNLKLMYFTFKFEKPVPSVLLWVGPFTVLSCVLYVLCYRVILNAKTFYYLCVCADFLLFWLIMQYTAILIVTAF